MLVAFDLPRETSKSLGEHKIRLSPRRFNLFSRHLSSDDQEKGKEQKLRKKRKGGKRYFHH